MSSTHGANASGRKSELKDSTGANPLGSGFGSGHSWCSWPLDWVDLSARSLSRTRARASIETCVALSIFHFRPSNNQGFDLRRRPSARDVRCELLQTRTDLVQLPLAQLSEPPKIAGLV